jgi:hypothetical protein
MKIINNMKKEFNNKQLIIPNQFLEIENKIIFEDNKEIVFVPKLSKYKIISFTSLIISLTLIITASILFVNNINNTSTAPLYFLYEKYHHTYYDIDFVSVDANKLTFDFTVLNKKIDTNPLFDKVVIDLSNHYGVDYHYRIFIDGIETDVRNKNKKRIRIDIVLSEEEMKMLVDASQNRAEIFELWYVHFSPVRRKK